MKAITQLRAQFECIGDQMVEMYQYAMHGPNYDEEKAEAYYELQRQYNDLRNQINDLLDKQPQKSTTDQPQTFVNGFGEATTRTITSLSYTRHQKRVSKAIMSHIGGEYK